ncbi:MAG: Hsp20/alpha crystallin family protein [Nocardioidaceae bacterium]
MTTLSLAPRRRDPFAEFDSLVRHAIGPDTGRSAAAGFTPAAEVTRDGDDTVVRLELPGVDVDNDVTVDVAGGRLVIRGERQEQHTEEQDGRSLREFRYGEFRRSFTLPKHVTSEAINASYDAGVLSIRVSGVHAGNEAQRITITSGASGAATAPSAEPGDDA